jgi:hypothetical protein
LEKYIQHQAVRVSLTVPYGRGWLKFEADAGEGWVTISSDIKARLDEAKGAFDEWKNANPPQIGPSAVRKPWDAPFACNRCRENGFPNEMVKWQKPYDANDKGPKLPPVNVDNSTHNHRRN